MSTLGCVTGFLEVLRTASRTISPSSQCLPFTRVAGAKGLPTGSVRLVSSSPEVYLPVCEEAELGEARGQASAWEAYEWPGWSDPAWPAFGAESKVLRPIAPIAQRGYYYSVFVGEEVGAQKG